MVALIPSYSAIAAPIKNLFELRERDRAATYLTNLYMANWDFDESWYFEHYPDLASAIPSKIFPSGFSHFRAVGYMEGRLPTRPQVDANWYMSNYPDVAAAILKGTFDSANQHFIASGYREGRLAESPDIDVEWYSQNYIPAGESDGPSLADCINHFKFTGYLNGALPRLKRQ